VTINKRLLFVVLLFRVVSEIRCVMDSFNLEAFVKEPTLQTVNLLRKAQLIEVANHYKLEVNGSMKKGEIK